MIKQIQVRPTKELLYFLEEYYKLIRSDEKITSGSDLLENIFIKFHEFIFSKDEAKRVESVRKYEKSLDNYTLSIPLTRVIIGNSVYEYPKPITFNIEEENVNKITDFLNENAESSYYRMSYIIKLASFVALKEKQKTMYKNQEIDIDDKMKYKLVNDIIVLLNHSNKEENKLKIKKIIKTMEE